MVKRLAAAVVLIATAAACGQDTAADVDLSDFGGSLRSSVVEPDKLGIWLADRNARLIAECMTERGWDYVGPANGSTLFLMRDRLGISELDFRELYGYGIVSQPSFEMAADPNYDMVQRLSPEALKQYALALSGDGAEPGTEAYANSCSGQADDEMMGLSKRIEEIQSIYLEEVTIAALSDPSMQQILEEWRACLGEPDLSIARNKLDVITILEKRFRDSSQSVELNQAQEIEIALREYECTAARQPYENEITGAYEQKFLEDHNQVLLEHKAEIEALARESGEGI